MSSPRLTEESVNLILDTIKTNINTALSAVRTDRADALVVLSDPQTYFIYEGAKGYKAPAIFVVAEEFDFKQSENGANHINGVVRINVSVVVEDREKSLLTIKAYRYQSALHSILAQARLESTDNKVLADVIVRKASYSPIYSSVQNKESTNAVFRKEVLFECDVYHRENF